jgi:uncharacterized protein YcbX
MTTGMITQLFIYPVKSLAGITCDKATVTARGLAGDREWMVVDDSGKFVTQRQLPAMATLAVELLDTGIALTSQRAGRLAVTHPALDAPIRPVRVWSDTCEAQQTAPEVSQWLSEALQSEEPLHLVKFAPTFTRPGIPERFGDATTQFADAAPFLIANQSSLIALNDHLKAQGMSPVDMRHFRPNIVANGLPAFAEHEAGAFRSDAGPAWELCDHCQRCSIITVDPDTGIRLPQAAPFKQLAAINPMPSNPKAPAFGVNARLAFGEAMSVSVGDAVHWVPS